MIQNNENLISLDNISIKSEINNAKFDKSCSLQNNNFLSNLSVLFVVKPLIQLDHKIELPYYVAFIGDENDILDIQYFSTVGEFKKNIETKKLIETDLISSNNKGLVVKLSGVTNRTASEALRGLELYLSRDLLPKLHEDEFYYSDLVGLVVENRNGEIIGTVSMVDNYGAGEVIEVDLEGGGTEMYRMSLAVVPEIDLKNGRIIVNPPFEVLAQKN